MRNEETVSFIDYDFVSAIRYFGIIPSFLQGLDGFLAFSGSYGAMKAKQIPATLDDVGFYYYGMDGVVGREAIG